MQNISLKDGFVDYPSIDDPYFVYKFCNLTEVKELIKTKDGNPFFFQDLQAISINPNTNYNTRLLNRQQVDD